MRVFITGGTGFIGKYVVENVNNDGNDILLLSRKSEDDGFLLKLPKNIKIIKGDLSNVDSLKEEVKRFKPEATINMAWEGIPDYSAKMSTKNLKNSLNLIETLAEIRCKKIICTGSCWEYGEKSGRLHENKLIKPSNAFTAAKSALYWLGKEIAKENDIQFIWTRFFYVYGPGQREESIIPYIINCIIKKKKKELKIKTPFARNDFVYVEDVAKAILGILKKCRKSTTYNIGSGFSTSVQDIINKVYNYYNINYEKIKIPSYNPNSLVDFWADITKIKNEIGWVPTTTIEEGIKKTIEGMKKN